MENTLLPPKRSFPVSFPTFLLKIPGNRHFLILFRKEHIKSIHIDGLQNDESRHILEGEKGGK